MSDFQQKKKFKKAFYSKASLVIIIALILFMIKPTYDIFMKYRASSNNYGVTSKDYEGLKTRKEMLEAQISKLKTDDGTEEELRSKFNVAKPGETVVVIVGSTSTSSSDSASAEKDGLWHKIKGMF